MEAWQERLLEDERSGVLGTIARSGLPQLVPVCFALVEGAIAIAIDEKPKRGVTLARVRNIERDPRSTRCADATRATGRWRWRPCRSSGCGRRAWSAGAGRIRTDGTQAKGLNGRDGCESD